MSMRHTGDGLPGDDDYYDSVEEESIRAAGSGRNPNAAAWDPEKMDLHGLIHIRTRRGGSTFNTAAGCAWTAAAGQ